MPNSLLNDLKLIVVALMWLFFLRAMRATWVEVRHTARVKESRRERKEKAKLDAKIASLSGSSSRHGSYAGPGVGPKGVDMSGAGTTGYSQVRDHGNQATGNRGHEEGLLAPNTHTILTVIEPIEHKGDEYQLTDDVSVIGRATGCAVLLDYDTFISHQHARIFLRGEELWIEDLGSTNGTYVNSKKLTSPVPLKNEDHIRVGNTSLEVAK